MKRGPAFWVWAGLLGACLGVGVVVLTLGLLPFEQVKPLLNGLSPDGSLESLTTAQFSQLVWPLRISGLLLLALGGALLRWRWKSQTGMDRLLRQTWADARSWVGELRQVRFNRWLVLIVLLVVWGAVSRWMFIERPMTHDEAYTFEAFATRSFFNVISDYHLPNNHVLHTILVYVSYHLFGDAPGVVRLPAFLSSVLMIPAAYWLGGRWYNPLTGVLAAAVVTAAPVMISYATNARGYSLMGLITLLILGLADRLRLEKNRVMWLALAVLAALGFYTLPVMLYPLGMVWLWLLASAWYGDISVDYGGRWGMVKYLAVFGGLAGVLALICYLPIFIYSGLASFTSNPFVSPLSWYDFWQSLPHRLQETWAWWNVEASPVFGWVLALGAVLATVWQRKTARHKVTFILVALVWLALVFLVQRPNPWPKVWTYLFAPVVICGSAGLLALARLAGERWQKIAAAGLVVIVLAANLLYTVQSYPEMHAPWQTERTAVYLAQVLQPGDVIAVAAPHDSPLWYYARRNGIGREQINGIETAQFQRVWVVVSVNEGQTLESVLRGFWPDLKPVQLAQAQRMQVIDNTEIYLCPASGQR